MTQTTMTMEDFEKAYAQAAAPKEVSAKDALKQLWEHEKNVRGIDWLSAEKNGEGALKEAVNKAQASVNAHVANLSDDEKDKAKVMGLLNSKGEAPDLSTAFFQTMAEGTPSLATFPDGALSYTVWGWSEETVAKYQAARGDDVEKYITNLVRNFQVMEQSDDVGITRICMEAGVIGFGLVGITAALNIIRTLSALTEATEAYAILEGVVEVGVNIIKLGVSVVILAILVPLMILMAKDAFGLFVIVNNSNEDLDMNAIEFTHGKCVAGFKENASADNPQAIIPKIFEIYNPKLQKTVKSMSAGFLGVRKRDNALIGTQGALSFASNSNYPDGIFLGWEVPLSIGDNRLLVSANYTGSVSDFSDQTDDSGVLDSSDSSSAGHTVDGHMNSGSGSKAYAFVFVN